MKTLLYDDSVNIVEISEVEWESFSIYVKSDIFSGQHAFFVEASHLSYDIKQLNKLYKNLCGEYVIEDMDSDSYLKFVMKKYGKLIFSGKLGGTHNNNYIVFEFVADQTLLQKFINFLV